MNANTTEVVETPELIVTKSKRGRKSIYDTEEARKIGQRNHCRELMRKTRAIEKIVRRNASPYQIKLMKYLLKNILDEEVCTQFATILTF